MANVPDHDGNDFPARFDRLQAGRWAAKKHHGGHRRQASTLPLQDKGIMAMIGSGSAVAEMGAHHELHGHAAFVAWPVSTPGG
jgi:NADH dehydrogenase FAD-containing subunit